MNDHDDRKILDNHSREAIRRTIASVTKRKAAETSNRGAEPTEWRCYGGGRRALEDVLEQVDRRHPVHWSRMAETLEAIVDGEGCTDGVLDEIEGIFPGRDRIRFIVEQLDQEESRPWRVRASSRMLLDHVLTMIAQGEWVRWEHAAQVLEAILDGAEGGKGPPCQGGSHG